MATGGSGLGVKCPVPHENCVRMIPVCDSVPEAMLTLVPPQQRSNAAGVRTTTRFARRQITGKFTKTVSKMQKIKLLLERALTVSVEKLL